MRNFHLVSEGHDFSPIVGFLKRRPDLWNQVRVRTLPTNSPHYLVDDIVLRFPDLAQVGELTDNDHECINYPPMFEIPGVRPVIMNLMRMVEGERLGRCVITRLKPNNVIPRHADVAEHAAYYDRYHVALQGAGYFWCAGEVVHMPTGSIWWFDNAQEHDVDNNDDLDRIHLIVDIRTAR